ncbi:MAG: hypothetical protein MUC96_25710, partial [Myxococcaceae bacterium]|nr:hypothetical protein [Myxococcaceae bacterium]
MFTLNDWLAATEEQRAVMLDQLEERLGHELLLSRAFGSESALPWVVDRASSLEFVLVPPGDSTFGVGDLDEPAPLRFFDEGWRLQYEAYELERLSVWRAPRRQRASWPALLVSVRRWPMAYAPFVELRGVAARDPTATEWLALTAAGSTTGSALAHPFGFEDWGTAP